MKSKLKIIIPLVLVLLAGVYKFVLSGGPAEAVVKPHVAGEVYVLPKDFLINLKGGRYAKLNVGMVLKHGFSSVPVAGGHEVASEPPEGYGTLAQEALIRTIVTDVLTDRTAEELVSGSQRDGLEELILKRIKKKTDVKAEEILITDLAVQ